MKYMFDKSGSALLVIDIQDKLFRVMDETVRESLVKNSRILIETSTVLSMPVIVTEQYRKGLGNTISEINEKISGCPNFEKTTFDCMKNREIADAVNSLGRKTIIICGIESHICVFQTALSLLASGYQVVIASDAVMSRRKSDWKAAMAALSSAGALVYPAETISFMLIEDASAPEFKKLSHLFK